MRYLLLSFILSAVSLFSIEPERPLVLVSVAPYRYFVHQIAKDLLDVDLMVPAGASAHTFEPTAKQMIQASRADLWFRIGEPFEKKAIDALKAAHREMALVDLRQGVNLLHSACTHHDHHASCGEDLHLWLSPRVAQIQSQTITKALSERYPQYRTQFEENLKKFLTDLASLDDFIRQTLAPVQNRTLMVSHPAYAYFCEEYQFVQLPIEFEGKDPTSKNLTQLLQKAKAAHAQAIFTQPQYSDKAARLIAKEIGAQLISVDPYSEDYENTLRKIAQLIAENR